MGQEFGCFYRTRQLDKTTWMVPYDSDEDWTLNPPDAELRSQSDGDGPDLTDRDLQLRRSLSDVHGHNNWNPLDSHRGRERRLSSELPGLDAYPRRKHVLLPTDSPCELQRPLRESCCLPEEKLNRSCSNGFFGPQTDQTH